MILHVFTKRKKDGIHVESGLEWKENFYEANRIFKKDTDEGFDFYLETIDGAHYEIGLNAKIQGYELSNESGVVIQRYVTPIE